MLRAIFHRRGREISQLRWASSLAIVAESGSSTFASDSDSGLELLRAHSRSDLRSYKHAVTPGAVAFALQKTRIPSEAKALFDWASVQPGFAHDETTAAALLGVFVKGRLFKDACRLFTSLGRLCSRSKLAFATIGEGYSYVGNMEAALMVLQELESLGMNIDTSLHNSVLKGLCKVGMLDDAMVHYKKMVANRDADFTSHSIVINELCKAGRVDAAVDIMYSMVDEGKSSPDLSIFNTIIEELCNIQKVDVAYLLMDQMVDRGCLPDITTYRYLLIGCFKSGQLVEASKLMTQMMDMGFAHDLDTLNTIIEELCNLRRVDDAKEILDEMGWNPRWSFPNGRTHKAYVRGLCKEKRLDEAQRHVQRMISTGCYPDAETYDVLIRALCRSGMIVDAQRLFSEMLGRGCVPDEFTYNLLISGHCEARQLSASYYLIKQMLDKGLAPDAQTTETLIQLLERRGKTIQAKDIAKRLSC